MSKMFYKAIQFNANISEWDVSRVKDMSDMFHRAMEFSQELCGHWITSEARGQANMFSGSKATLCPPKVDSDTNSKIVFYAIIVVVAVIILTTVATAIVLFFHKRRVVPVNKKSSNTTKIKLVDTICK